MLVTTATASGTRRFALRRRLVSSIFPRSTLQLVQRSFYSVLRLWLTNWQS